VSASCQRAAPSRAEQAMLSCKHRISPAWRNGRTAPIFFEENRAGLAQMGLLGRKILAPVHEKEKELTREVAGTVERQIPGVEVLAVELLSPTRFCVFIDHPKGVDHALCARVTDLLRGYLNRYTVDVSSPGIERPLRKPAHFRNAVGRRVAVRTAEEIEGRKRFRGQVLAANDESLSLGAEDGKAFFIPYAAIVRGNLIDEVN
jgi:ribosome maturation factor RimP